MQLISSLPSYEAWLAGREQSDRTASTHQVIWACLLYEKAGAGGHFVPPGRAACHPGVVPGYTVDRTTVLVVS